MYLHDHVYPEAPWYFQISPHDIITQSRENRRFTIAHLWISPFPVVVQFQHPPVSDAREPVALPLNQG